VAKSRAASFRLNSQKGKRVPLGALRRSAAAVPPMPCLRIARKSGYRFFRDKRCAIKDLQHEA